MMKYATVAIVAALLLIVGFSASAQTGTLSVATYGAKCNGSTDDTAAFQSAATAAANLYASKGPVTITYAGNCVVNGSVSYGSGVHWRGYGVITVQTQGSSPTFNAESADDVAWDDVEIDVINPAGDNPHAAGIGWFSNSGDSAQHHHVRITNCQIYNSSWGISIFFNNGPGSLDDVEIANNKVATPLTQTIQAYSWNGATLTNWDGIHVGGTVTNVRIVDNTVTNRGDGAISLTSEANGSASYVLSQAVIANNIVTQDRVGIDIGGATNVNVSGNFVQATAPDPTPSKQNPAFRQIWYGNQVSLNIHTLGNHFETGAGASYTAKIDPEVLGNTSWPPLNSTFEKNTIGGPNNSQLLYLRGSSIFIDGNTFTQSGGTLFLDYDGTDGVATSNILIGSNWWFGNATVDIGGGGLSNLFQNVKMAPQIATGTATINNPGNAQMISY
jgi:hypothetical protein